MDANIERMILVSRRIKRLLEADREVTELAYVKLVNSNKLSTKLKEVRALIKEDVNHLKRVVSASMRRVPGFNPEKHLLVNYITDKEINEKKVDLTTDEEGDYLDLESGIIIHTLKDKQQRQEDNGEPHLKGGRLK